MEVEEKKSFNGVTTGTFDGVHRGHQALLRLLAKECGLRGAEPVVLTFDRHPLEVIAPERAPKLLMLPAERDLMLASSGMRVVELPFTEALRRLTAAEWMRELKERYGAALVVTGYDNSFGSDCRTLSDDDYAAMARDLGLEYFKGTELPGISSSRIRHSLEDGDIESVNRMLGRDWHLAGNVEAGLKVGRKLGFPTANLRMDPRLALPGTGVYATTVTLPDGSRLPAITNVGVRPTFGGEGKETTVETHIPGFSGDLYDREIDVTFHKWLRGERRFDSAEDLRRQIERDVAGLRF